MVGVGRGGLSTAGPRGAFCSVETPVPRLGGGFTGARITKTRQTVYLYLKHVHSALCKLLLKVDCFKKEVLFGLELGSIISHFQ